LLGYLGIVELARQLSVKVSNDIMLRYSECIANVLDCPADSTTDCEIWAFFTDDNEDNEEGDEDQNEDRQQDEEMAENEQQDGEMDDDEQRDKVAEAGQRDEDMAEDGQVTEQRERVVSKGKGKKDKNGKNGKSKKGKSKGKKQ
jgi:hypothetical protein